MHVYAYNGNTTKPCLEAAAELGNIIDKKYASFICLPIANTLCSLFKPKLILESLKIS